MVLQNESIEQKIIHQVDQNFEEQLDFLSKLVTFKSLVGQEGEAQNFCANAYRELGLMVELFEAEKGEIQSHPAYIEIGLDYSGRPNVISQLQGEGGDAH